MTLNLLMRGRLADAHWRGVGNDPALGWVNRSVGRHAGAAAFKAIMDAHGWSANRLAQELGLPQQSISSALSLLKLGPELQARIDAGTQAPTIGHELARIDDEVARAALLARIEAEGLKRDEVAAAVKASNSSAGKGRGTARGRRSGAPMGSRAERPPAR